MANFLDNRPPVFNPYVEQLPVSAMVQVGETKQNQYDQGIQKIQSQIDNVSGLDVMRDVDKQYLQSKLDTLGNNLKTVAAGDFSNFQLVNSVGGMANQIVKDPNVQNAVSSTINHHRQTELMQQDRSKGNLAPDNEIDYQKQVSSYMNGKVGDLFTGQYTPWTDVNKKLLAAGEAVGLDEKTTQQLFRTDANGKPLIDTNGTPIYDPVMVERHLKGKDPAKLLEAFKNALTPQDYNQLAITGRYMNGGLNSQQLAQKVNDNYSENINQVDGKLTDINLKLTEENAKVNPDQNLLNSLYDQKTYFGSMQDKLIRARDAGIQQAISNPDSVRGSLYTDNYLSATAKSLSSMTEDITNKVSPMFDVQMRQAQFNEEVKRDNMTDYHWAKDFLYKQNKDAADMKFAEDKLKAEHPELIGTGGVQGPIDTHANSYEILKSGKDDYTQMTSDLTDLNRKIAMKYMRNTYPELSDTQLTAKLNNFTASQGITTDPIQYVASLQLAKWNAHPEDIPVQSQGLMSEQKELIKALSVQQAAMTDSRNNAIQKAKDEGIVIPKDSDLLNQLQGTSIRLPKRNTNPNPFGKPNIVPEENINIPAKDILLFAKLHPEARNVFGVSDQEKQIATDARAELTKTYGKNVSDIEARLYNFPQIADNVNIPASIAFSSTINKAQALLGNTNYSRIAELEAEEYVKNGAFRRPQTFTIPIGKQNEKDVEAKEISILQQYAPSNSKVSDLITQIQSGKIKIPPTITATPGLTSRTPVTYTWNIGDTPIKISPDHFTSLTGQPAMNNQGPSPVIVNLNHFNNSGPNGILDPRAAYFGAADFTKMNTDNYTVTGNYVGDDKDSNKAWLYLYIHKKDGTTKTISYDQPFYKTDSNTGAYNQDLEKVVPSSFTPDVINQILNKVRSNVR